MAVNDRADVTAAGKDKAAELHWHEANGWIRIVDDTEEDYLFAPDEFEIIKE